MNYINGAVSTKNQCSAKLRIGRSEPRKALVELYAQKSKPVLSFEQMELFVGVAIRNWEMKIRDGAPTANNPGARPWTILGVQKSPVVLNPE